MLTSMLDPHDAAARDRAFRSGALPPPREIPGIGRDGFFAPPPLAALAGERAVQGVVEAGSRTGRFDDVAGRGFVLLLAAGDPDELLDGELLAYVTDVLGGVVVSLDPSVARGVRDADGALEAWLRDNGAGTALIRPDGYVFGSFAEPAGAARLVRALREAVEGHASDASELGRAA